MAENYRLYVKSGDFEFEGEGAREHILQDLAMWREVAHKSNGSRIAQAELDQAPAGETILSQPDVDRVFEIDTKKKIVSLKLFPRSEDKNGASFLLVLYGYRRFFELGEVPVTLLKVSLKQSGCVVDRIDDVASKPLKAGLANKGGRGKGGRYSITNTGSRAAELLISGLLS
jgi:hypothetical protein